MQIRQRLIPQDGMRPSFLGHILVELLLDAELIAENPRHLDAYYGALEALDADAVTGAVTRIAARGVELLAALIPRFCRERFLYDYLEDGKLLTRINGVMRRVGLAPIPEDLSEWFPEAREAVRSRRTELLATPS